MKSTNKVLVIGGGGFIGAHLVPQLVEKGYVVTILGRSSASSYKLPKGANYVVGDYSRRDLICDLLEDSNDVIHLAHSSLLGASVNDPVSNLLSDLPGTVQLFSEAARRGVKVTFISSGGAIYGQANKCPINENHPTNPISTYGLTKLTLENYARFFGEAHGLKHICIRPANAYGVGQKPFTGQGFIATAVAAATQKLPINIFGENGVVRDYLYVSDIASGIICAMERGRLSEIYNLGSGVGRSNLEIIDSIKLLMAESDRKINIENLLERKFDVRVNFLDSKKLFLDTGWKQNISFERGLKSTFDWLNNQKFI